MSLDTERVWQGKSPRRWKKILQMPALIWSCLGLTKHFEIYRGRNPIKPGTANCKLLLAKIKQRQTEINVPGTRCPSWITSNWSKQVTRSFPAGPSITTCQPSGKSMLTSHSFGNFYEKPFYEKNFHLCDYVSSLAHPCTAAFTGA